MSRFEKLDEVSCGRGYLDNDTGLVWEAEDEPGWFSHEEAMELNTAIWRLPTIKELVGIIDYDICEPATLLPGIKLSYYWSASPHASGPRLTWLVNFGGGCSDYYNHHHSRYVRMVARHRSQ